MYKLSSILSLVQHGFMHLKLIPEDLILPLQVLHLHNNNSC